MNPDLEVLLSGSLDFTQSAGAIVRWAKGDEQLLLEGAEAWLGRFVGARRLPSKPLWTDIDAAFQLLQLLPGDAPVFARAVRSAALFGLPGALELLMAVVDTRTDPSKWRELLLPLVNDASHSHWMSEGVLHALGEQLPGLAYELLDAGTGERAALALAIFRIGLSPEFDHESKRLVSLSAKRLLGDDVLTEWAARALKAGRPVPALVSAAIAGATNPATTDDDSYLRALILLAAQGREKRPEVVERIRAWVSQDRQMGLGIVSNWMNAAGHGLLAGWASQDERLLGVLARLFVDRGEWPSRFWDAALKPHWRHPPLERKRELGILGQGLIQIADDASVDFARRRAAIEAIGRSGFGRLASRLGKYSEIPELAEAVKAARKQLQRADHGHAIDPENGFRLALAHMNVRTGTDEL